MTETPNGEWALVEAGTERWVCGPFPFAEPPTPGEGQKVVQLPPSFPDGVRWSEAAGACVPIERVITAQESFALLTGAEKARMLTSGEQAVLQLMLAALAFGSVVVGSVEHQQAVAVMVGAGVIAPEDVAARVPQILAGSPPPQV